MKRRIVSSPSELDNLERTITRAAAATADSLSHQLQLADPLSALARLKFDRLGCDPLDITRALNFVEQLNQSFTYLASIEATRWLFDHHPESAPFQLNLGTASGSDIVSADGEVVAEVFAATHPDSNAKLRKDIEKVRKAVATHRYVFYLSPAPAKVRVEDVVIVRLDHACLSSHLEPNA